MNKVALLFPGGGTQYIGMGKAMYDAHKEVREIFEEANDLMQYNLKKICFEGNLDKLSIMNNSQPAIFTVSFAAYQVFKKEMGITPAFACGHSLGEYAALTCAGALQFNDALQIIKKRGMLLQEAGARHDATMMAVSKVNSAVIEEECNEVIREGGYAYIAVYNSEKQHVISGTRKDINRLAVQLTKRGADPVILNISTPSHCPLMVETAKEFKSELQKFTYTFPLFPVISNVSGLPYKETDNIFEILTDHMIKPVRWFDSMCCLEDHGVTHAVEIGPQAVLKNLVPFITKKIHPFSFDITDDVAEMKNVFGSMNNSPESIIRRCIAIAVSTKNYNTDELEYEEGVVKPFARIRQMHELINEQSNPQLFVTEAIQALTGILDVKKTPPADKYKHLSSIASQ